MLPKNNYRKAIIDIGTNTILLLIAEFDTNTESIKTIQDIQRIPRLGKGVDKNRIISLETINIACKVLNEYKNIASDYNVNEIIATATSFLRDAANRDEFVSEIHKNTGLKIELLSGKDEAKWTFIGGSFDFIKSNPGKQITIIDIGGGSTEITSGSFSVESVKELSNGKNSVIKGQSLNIGSVRIHEKFLKQQPPAELDISQAQEFIINEFKNLAFDSSNSTLIGLAGTITTLASMKLNLDKFESDKVDGLIMTIDNINELYQLISKKTQEQLLKLGDYMQGRSDIILSGILILKTFIEHFHFKELTVSTKGLRYGIFLREVILK